MHEVTRLFVLIAVCASLSVISGCGGGNDSGPSPIPPPAQNAPPSTPTLGVPVAMKTTVDIVGSDIVAKIPGVVTVAVPSGSLQKGSQVTLSLTSALSTAGTFDVESDILGIVRARQAYEHRINFGSARPAADKYGVTITLSADFASALQASETAVVFAQLEEEDSIGFEAVDSIFDAGSHTIALSLPSGYFSSLRTTDGSYEAVLLVAAVVPSSTTGRATLTKVPISGGTAGASDRVRALRVLDEGNFTYTEGLNSPLTRRLPDSPTSPFSPARLLNGVTRPHRGIDIAALDKTSVFAVADGVVEERLQTSNPCGYGKYAVVRHPDGSASVYAHLSSVDVVGAVRKGQRIASSGHSGGADPSCGAGRGPHLHFELIPKGVVPPQVLPPTLRRIDTWPLIQKLSSVTNDPRGSLQASLDLNASKLSAQLMAMGTVATAGTASSNITEDSGGAPLGVEDIRWVSGNEQLVTVDQKGFVSVVYPPITGSATVSAIQSSSGITKTLLVNITMGQRASIGAASSYFEIDDSSTVSPCAGPPSRSSSTVVGSPILLFGDSSLNIPLVKNVSGWQSASATKRSNSAFSQILSSAPVIGDWNVSLSSSGILTTTWTATGSRHVSVGGGNTQDDTTTQAISESIDLNTGAYSFNNHIEVSLVNTSPGAGCGSLTPNGLTASYTTNVAKTTILPISLKP